MIAPRPALRRPALAFAAAIGATPALAQQAPAVRGPAPRHAPAPRRPAATFASIVDREVRLLEWSAAAPLSPAERARTRAGVAEAVRGDPVATLRADRRVTRMLALIPTWDPGDAEAAREALRLGFALARPSWPARRPLTHAERDIVTAHDPVVVFDSAHRRLVTERSLRVLRTAAAWNARAMGVPGPDASFVDRARQGLRANFARFARQDPSVADGFAHIAEAAREEPVYFAHVTPVRRAAVAQEARAQVLATADRAGQQWRLATLTAWVSNDARAASPRQVTRVRAVDLGADATSGPRADDARPTPPGGLLYASRGEPARAPRR